MALVFDLAFRRLDRENNDPIFLPDSQRMRKIVLWNQPSFLMSFHEKWHESKLVRAAWRADVNTSAPQKWASCQFPNPVMVESKH